MEFVLFFVCTYLVIAVNIGLCSEIAMTTTGDKVRLSTTLSKFSQLFINCSADLIHRYGCDLRTEQLHHLAVISRFRCFLRTDDIARNVPHCRHIGNHTAVIGTTATIGDNRVEISVVNLFEEIHCFSCLVATKREREQIITFDIYIILFRSYFTYICPHNHPLYNGKKTGFIIAPAF